MLWSVFRMPAQRACGGNIMIFNLTEYKKAQEEMIARLHEELAVFEGSEEARQPVSP